jgi:hypothetical protein
MAAEVKTIGPELSDLVLSINDWAYSVGEIEVDNSEGTDPIVIPSGSPADTDGTLITASALAGGGTQTECLVLGKQIVDAGKVMKVPVLLRGPAILKKSGLPALDYEGASFNTTTLATEIATLSPLIILRDALTTVEEQTT